MNVQQNKYEETWMEGDNIGGKTGLHTATRIRKHWLYLSAWTSSTKSIPIQIPTGVPVPVVVSELIHNIFSSSPISLSSTSFIPCILSMLVHFLQGDAELG